LMLIFAISLIIVFLYSYYLHLFYIFISSQQRAMNKVCILFECLLLILF
jgi:hypothetical protein